MITEGMVVAGCYFALLAGSISTAIGCTIKDLYLYDLIFKKMGLLATNVIASVFQAVGSFIMLISVSTYMTIMVKGM